MNYIAAAIACVILGVGLWSRRSDVLSLIESVLPGKLDASKLPASVTDPAVDDVHAAWELYRRLYGDNAESRKLFETGVREKIRDLIQTQPVQQKG